MTGAAATSGGMTAYPGQQRAADPNASVWVAASAGAGKTKVLVDRVLRLMLSGTRPERILCLTFTRAAAAEMANRVNAVLGGWAAGDDPALARAVADLTGAEPDDEILTIARRLFADVLDAPGGMRIMTIHAFCESLLGRFPLEAGVAPHFQVMDERTAAETMHAARDDLLERAQRGGDPILADALATVTGWAGEDEFVTLMALIARDRGRLATLLSGDSAQLRERVMRRLGVVPGETVEAVVATACDEASFDAEGLRAAAGALARGSDTDQKRGASIAGWLADPGKRASSFDDYAALFLTRENQPRKTLMTKPVAEEFPGALEIMAREAARLIDVTARRKALAVAHASGALLALAGGLLETYEAHKTAHALLDYDDLILKGRALVEAEGGASWALYKLDGGLDHILIDEAQDTNPDQWAVVRAIAEEFFAGAGAGERPRTVFAVGDAKQSIFSFQRAAPEEFRRMSAYFAERVAQSGGAWESVGLDVSFRSAEPVLAAVDAVFAREDAHDGLDEETITHTAHRAGQAGQVEVWPPVLPDDRDDIDPWAPPSVQMEGDPPAHRLARVIAARIKNWIADGERLESRDRAVRAGDIMVLVRRRTALVDELVSALKNLDVPVAGVDRMVLGDQLAIMDLVALGQFLLLPEDDLTLACVLKGPLIGLDEEALFDLAYGRAEDRSLWRELRHRAPRDDRYADAVELLSALMARADYVPPYEFYADILGPRRGREHIVARLGMEANDPLDEFLALALSFERTHPSSLQGFLQWFVEGRSEIKRDLEHAARDEVRVMTVHGAKGLQAPVVILADTMQTPRRGETRLLWSEDEGGPDPLALWTPRRAVEEPVSAALREAAERENDREYRRLLYVAMTRAEDRLYVCGYGTRNKTPEDCWYNLVVRGLSGIAEEVTFDLAAPGIAGWSGAGLRMENAQRSEPDNARVEAARATEAPPPLPSWARAPAPAEPEPPRPLTPSRPADDAPPVDPPHGDREAAIRRGNLVHRLLQALPEIEPAGRRAAARRFLERPVHELVSTQRDEIINEALAVLESPEFAPLFGPESRAEVPIVGEVGGMVISGRIDRLAVTGESVLIVDFKANRTPPAEDGELPVAYVRQLAAYRAVLRRIYPKFTIRCALLWSAVPRLDPVGNAVLDRHAP